MVNKASGVTLTELMATLAVMVIVMLAALPLTMSWVHGSQVGNSKALLLQGYDNAKALALRNPTAARTSTPAAGLKLVDGSTLLVCKGDPDDADCVAAGSAVVWEADLSVGKGVAVTLNSLADTTIDLSNIALPSGAPRYSVTKGSESDAGTLY